jgi:hypothetical protein
MNEGISALESRGLRLLAPSAFRLAFGVGRAGREAPLSKSTTNGDDGEMAFRAGAGDVGSGITAGDGD